MGRTTNEQLKKQIDELYKKLPNGDFKLLKVQVLEMQDDIRSFVEEQGRLVKRLYNPDNGIVVNMRDISRLTQEMHDKLDMYFPMIDKMSLKISYFEKFKDNVVRALWISYTAISGLLIKIVFWE
tara:strand:+ start:3241 stop:3615 length:375 start_codon:yes stop_codon:yes gene_type:complete